MFSNGFDGSVIDEIEKELQIISIFVFVLVSDNMGGGGGFLMHVFTIIKL